RALWVLPSPCDPPGTTVNPASRALAIAVSRSSEMMTIWSIMEGIRVSSAGGAARRVGIQMSAYHDTEKGSRGTIERTSDPSRCRCATGISKASTHDIPAFHLPYTTWCDTPHVPDRRGSGGHIRDAAIPPGRGAEHRSVHLHHRDGRDDRCRSKGRSAGQRGRSGRGGWLVLGCLHPAPDQGGAGFPPLLRVRHCVDH